jgi:PAS domain S-box-containing protein
MEPSMKIRQKLILGFAGIASFVAVAGLLCVRTAQEALQESIGQSSVAIAVETMDKVDQEINHAIQSFQVYCRDTAFQQAVARSNQEFEKLQNLQDYIDKTDAEWASAKQGRTGPSIKELMDNELSAELRERLKFHERNSGRETLGGVLVTNKYGAIVGLTRQTSGYRQDDEPWWQKAREDGLYVGGVKYDERTGTYSINIAIRADNPQKEFVGVLKAVLSFQGTINIIKKARALAGRNIARLGLFDQDGKLIYDESGEPERLSSISQERFFDQIADDRGYFLKRPEKGKEPEDRLLVYARSQRHGNHKGLGWILAMEYRTAELFAPVARLKRILLGTSLLLTLLAVVSGLVISGTITKPLSKLKAAADKIHKGELSTRAHVKTTDEIGQLADAFNHMAEQRSRAENALGISEAKLDAILRAIADEIALIDEDLNIIWTNDVAKRTYGDDIIGKKCYEVYHQRSTPCEPHPCPALRAFRDGKVHHYEAQVTNRQGMIKYLDTIANVAFRNEDGKPTAVLEICRDITERKQVEEALDKLNKDMEAANVELTRTNKDIEEFAYITAHDLKTPLRAIGTLADWIAADYADKFDEPGREQVKLLVSKAKQMAALIDDILEYSRLGRNDAKKEEVDLNIVLGEVIAAINPPEHIQIASETELPTLVCEKTHVIEIFQNLLTNAVKYMDKPDGRIIVGGTEREDSWQFTVTDNGLGIDGKYFEKIFKIFQTLAPREGIESTGIGLSIVKKLVELNNGRVWVESELGKGSTFFFTLPKVCPATDASASQPPQQ